MNTATFTGHLGANPTTRSTKTDELVTELRVAINDRGHTTWVSVTTFGKLAEQCAEHLTKGRQVGVQGRLHETTWKDENGRKRSRLQIIASDVDFLAHPTARDDENNTDTDPEPDDTP